MIKAPTPPANTPPYAVAILRDLIAWVRVILRQPVYLPSYTVAALPSASEWFSSHNSALIFVADEAGGAVPAFTDGSDWRRVTDRAVVS